MSIAAKIFGYLFGASLAGIIVVIVLFRVRQAQRKDLRGTVGWLIVLTVLLIVSTIALALLAQ